MFQIDREETNKNIFNTLLGITWDIVGEVNINDIHVNIASTDAYDAYDNLVKNYTELFNNYKEKYKYINSAVNDITELNFNVRLCSNGAMYDLDEHQDIEPQGWSSGDDYYFDIHNHFTYLSMYEICLIVLNYEITKEEE